MDFVIVVVFVVIVVVKTLVDVTPELFQFTKPTKNILPVHLLPSPEYPALHVQVYDPRVSLHTALTSQLCELVEHSSISKKV